MQSLIHVDMNKDLNFMLNLWIFVLGEMLINCARLSGYEN